MQTTNIIIPDEAKKALIETLAKCKHPVVFSNTGEGRALIEWLELGKPFDIVPVIQHEQYICCIDCAYGNDLVWDGQKWHIKRNGVFTQDFVFVSNHHDFEDGALFLRVKENNN